MFLSLYDSFLEASTGIGLLPHCQVFRAQKIIANANNIYIYICYGIL
jgi:hypothetical protein